MTIPISSTPIVFFLSLLTGISFSHLKLAIRTLALISLFYFVNPLFSHVIFFSVQNTSHYSLAHFNLLSCKFS